MALWVILTFVFIVVWVSVAGQFKDHSEAVFVVIMWVVREYFGKHQQQTAEGKS